MTEEQVYTEIGRRMRILRRWRKLKQQEVADRMRLTRVSVTNAETGRQKMPVWNLLQLSRIYAVPPHVWLLTPEEWQAWCKAAGVSATRRVLKTVQRVSKRRVWVEEREVAT